MYEGLAILKDGTEVYTRGTYEQLIAWVDEMQQLDGVVTVGFKHVGGQQNGKN